ncbi:nuclear transport factor 2 family protein [Psychrosphaera sp. 1_MG-2023]|uniref:YybH family protein n=1 Tax=Psychrosphaera sp. 1_MG-2023 TaxID=3062643 RepID=UPI0026E344D9|nr:nuclear transport factor 2 family protein [Psychrosphaera sp. 1_MG-2023]MDO6719172.1 nuclear transport factor 2 family protein [Psychrosphaera sp. 1_MG-2023]
MIKKNVLLTLLSPLVLAGAMLSGIASFNTTAHGNEPLPKSNPMFVGMESDAADAINSFHKALRSGDKKTARAFLADDIVIFEGKGVERSADEYANHHMLSDMKYLAVINSKKLEHQVFVKNDMAYSFSRSKTTGTYKDKTVDYISLETMTLVKTDQGWKATHIHWSR